MKPQRRRPAHHPPLTRDNRTTIIFVTVCTAGRRPLLGSTEAHETLREAWQAATGWSVGRYVILPDHLHLFCAPGVEEPPPLRAWVRYWKTLASRRWPAATAQPIWQLGFWDRQLRSGESYRSKWDYVRGNPVRHGLVPRPRRGRSKASSSNSSGTTRNIEASVPANGRATPGNGMARSV